MAGATLPPTRKRPVGFVPYSNRRSPEQAGQVVATDMKHAATRDLYCYWDSLRGARTAPERVDIDPGAIRRILGDTFIVEVDDARAYPFRLAGTRLCAMMGHELRGWSLLESWADADRREMARLLAAVSDDSAAVVVGVEADVQPGPRPRPRASDAAAAPSRQDAFAHPR